MLRHRQHILNSRRNFKYSDVHVEGAERIAKVAAQSGVSRLVHVSHLNASATSSSTFYKSKAEGDERVRAAFPGATIVRPATMYGYEDRFLNNMASACFVTAARLLLTLRAVWPIWWKLNHMKTTVRPAHVRSLLPRVCQLLIRLSRLWTSLRR